MTQLSASSKLKTAIVFVVAVLLSSVGSISYARDNHRNNNAAGVIVAGALIGTVVGLTLAAHHEGRRFKHHYHSGHKCYKRHGRHNRRHDSGYASHHNSHQSSHNYRHSYRYNNHYNTHRSNHHNDHYNKRHHSNRRSSDREVHHYYSDSRKGSHQKKRYLDSRNSESYVSVRGF